MSIKPDRQTSAIQVRAHYHRTDGEIVTSAEDVDSPFAFSYSDFGAPELRDLFYDAAYVYAPRDMMASLGKLADQFRRGELWGQTELYELGGTPAGLHIAGWLERWSLESTPAIAYDVFDSFMRQVEGAPFRLRASRETFAVPEKPVDWPPEATWPPADRDTIDLEALRRWQLNVRTQTLNQAVDQVCSELRRTLKVKLEPIYESARLLGVVPNSRRKARRNARWTVLWHIYDLTPAEISDFDADPEAIIDLRDGGCLRRVDFDDPDDDSFTDLDDDRGEGPIDDLKSEVERQKSVIGKAVRGFAGAIGLQLKKRDPGPPTSPP